MHRASSTDLVQSRQSMLTNREFVKAGSELVVSQWKLVSVPWDIFRHYISFCATVLLEVLVWVGAKPHNYRTPAEKQQQAAVIDHLQKSVVALTNEQKVRQACLLLALQLCPVLLPYLTLPTLC